LFLVYYVCLNDKLLRLHLTRIYHVVNIVNDVCSFQSFLHYFASVFLAPVKVMPMSGKCLHKKISIQEKRFSYLVYKKYRN